MSKQPPEILELLRCLIAEYERIAIATKTKLRQVVKVGKMTRQLMIKYRPLRKRINKTLREFIKEEAPDISVRSCQRYERISRYIDEDSHPLLFSLGIVQAERLIIACNNEPIMKTIQAFGIDLSGYADKTSGHRIFKHDIKVLIRALHNGKKAKPTRKREPNLVQFSKLMSRLVKSTVSIMSTDEDLDEVDLSLLGELIAKLTALRKLLKD